MHVLSATEAPIGVFDSGVGGLTVLRALRGVLPNESFIYLGDTARLPYGTKSARSVVHYSIQAADFLVDRGVKYLVIACNTASAAGLDVLRERLAPMPVMGVIEPGAAAGSAASRTGHIAVIATEGAVQGGAYPRAIARLRPEATVYMRACSLFVALAEEGWTDGSIVEAVAHRYLDDLVSADSRLDTLLLGCTHFPVLKHSLSRVMGPSTAIVDSADAAAMAVAADLRARGLATSSTRGGSVRLLATDAAERFARVGGRFLGVEAAPHEVEVVDLGRTRIDGNQ